MGGKKSEGGPDRLYWARRRVELFLGGLWGGLRGRLPGLRHGLGDWWEPRSKALRKRASGAVERLEGLRRMRFRDVRRALSRAFGRTWKFVVWLSRPAAVVAFFWLFLSGVLGPVHLENSTVSGVLARDMVWSGRVNVTGDVLLPPRFLLRIEPGTVVWFVPGESDSYMGAAYSRSHASLAARIIADGATFTSAGGHADWERLWLFNGSRLNDSVVEYARDGVVLDGSNVTLTGTISRYSLRYCLDNRGGNVSGGAFHHCWRACALVPSGTLAGSELYECNEGARVGVNATLRSNLIAQSCVPLAGNFTNVTRLSNRIMGTEPHEEGGFYNDVLVYPACD